MRSDRVPARDKQEKLLRVAGLHAVEALFASAPQRIERLFFGKELRLPLAECCRALAAARKPFREVGKEELARVAGTVLHGGVVAVARPAPIARLDVSRAAVWARDGKLLLLIDGIGNPHNLGAIARTAAFFGLPRLVLSNHPAQALPSDASYRVAEGGLDRIDIYRSQNFVRDLEGLRPSYLVLGAAAEGGLAPARFGRAGRALALVLGNEEHGFPSATAHACQALVTIARTGAVQSLNVAATAAILIHALGT